MMRLIAIILNYSNFLAIFLAPFLHHAYAAPANLPSSELQALQDLYESTNGRHWHWDSITTGEKWDFTELDPNPCEENWQGITCILTNPTTYHVFELILEGYNLKGTLPQSIGDFPAMVNLDLYYNSLNGSIPLSLGNLTALREVNLKDNVLTGQIPSTINQLTSITSISFDYNLLTGTLPDISNLQSLLTVIWRQNFIAGSVPASYGALHNLKTLDLSCNVLSHTIPESLGNLKNLSSFYLWQNELTGTIPASLGNLTKTDYFQLLVNQLTGSIPESLGNFKRIINLDLSSNFLTNALPATFTKSTLTYLKIFQNFLSHPLPATLMDLPKLTIVEANDNMFSGTLPESFANWKQMYYFDISNNFITGTLPISLNQLPALVKFDCLNNSLSGPIVNRFNVSLQTGIEEISIGFNQFTGSIPKDIFLLPKLSSFIALSNCFTGSLPNEICHAKKLYSLTLDGLNTATSCRINILPWVLSNNNYVASKALSGGIPECLYSALPMLNSLHVSGNGFTGTLPSNISASITDLAVSNNLLEGSLPLTYQSRKWYNLDISFNRITGLLDSSFKQGFANASLSMQNNRLSGNIPSTVADDATISLLEGNLFACAFNRHDLPTNDSSRETYECGSNSFQLSIYAWMVLLVVLVAGVVCVQMCRSDADGRRNTWEVVLGNLREVKAVIFWIDELEGGPSQTNTVTTRDGNDVHDEEEDKQEDTNENKLGANKQILVFDDIARGYCSLLALQNLLLFAFVVSVAILLPLYYGLHTFFGNYSVSYAWEFSAGFLHGITAGILALLGLLLFLFGVVLLYDYSYRRKKHVLLQRNCDHTNSNQRNISVSDQQRHNLQPLRTESVDLDGDTSTGPASASNSAIRTSSSTISKLHLWQNLRQYGFLSLLTTIAIAVVLTVNFLFVKISIESSSEVVVVAQFALAVFKFLWNFLFIRYFSIAEIRRLSNNDWTAADFSFFPEENDVVADTTRTNLYFQSAIVFINNIVIPCIASATLQSNCFFHVLQPPPAVYSSYNSNNCDAFIMSRNIFICTGWILVPQYVSYIPPFTYSYQCTGSLLKDYASTFVYVMILNALLGPFLHACVFAWKNTSTETEEKNIGKLTKCLDFLVPALLRKENHLGESIHEKDQSKMIFNKTNFVVTTYVSLAILLTFGAVFPPVAVVSILSIMCNVLWHQYCLGWYVRENIWACTTTEVASKHRSNLNQQIKHLGSMMATALHAMVPFVVGFYLFFTFDMVGSTNGFLPAIISCVIIIAVLLVIRLLIFVGEKYYKYAVMANPTSLPRMTSAEGNAIHLTDIYTNPMH